MSTGQESNVDIVAVACVVEASLLLASEWSRILTEYVFPLLRRLNEATPFPPVSRCLRHLWRCRHNPQPLVSKRFFAPLSQIRKELNEDPSKLGIGQTNSGSGRGLCALEGLVAAIELFDILMTSVNLPTPQSPQKESRSLILHMLHIAASPPDDAKKPHCNTMHYLDSVSWDSMPAELRKRKINLSLISLTKIPLFQDLQSSVAGSMTQSPWFDVHAPHVLSLAGFPAPQKTSIKRQPDVSDQSPDTKRQKFTIDSTSKRPSASPALPPARIPIPQNQRPQQPVPPQVAPPQPPPPPPTPAAAPNPPSTQSVQATPAAPASTPATSSSTAQPPPSGPSMTSEFLEQNVDGIGLTFGQAMEHLRTLDREVTMMEEQISHPQIAGQTVVLTKLQKERASKIYIREQIKLRLRQHYHKTYGPKDAPNPQAGSAASTVQNLTVEVGPSAQSHPPNTPNPSSEKPPGPTTEEPKPVLSDAQIMTNLWQSRGGTLSVLGGDPSAGPNQPQPQPTSEVAAQMQKLIEKKGIRPPVAGPSSQASGTLSQETGINSTAMTQPFIPKPNNNGQGASEMQLQIHAIGMYAPGTPSDVRTDNWPKNLILNTCKEPLKDAAELPSWLKRHQPRSHIMQFKPNPRVPDAPLNEQKFQGLKKHMLDRRMFAYAGWQLPSGTFSYNIRYFSNWAQFRWGSVPEGIPDFPGGVNALDNQPPAAEVKPLAFGAPNFPPALKARLQGLEPAKQRQLLAQWIRASQEHLRRQQLQQTQQVHNTSGQALNTLGMSIPPNMYNTVANIPAGLQLNVNANAPMNAGSYNTASGTVNYEMLQSFMQRNAEGSTSASQGINPS
ncbi:hypothetical protein JVU11DRAFT_4255 [Chiua virens]|nr:hypothetical protein JVU11DRAFT_4255 [Chiua virens]